MPVRTTVGLDHPAGVPDVHEWVAAALERAGFDGLEITTPELPLHPVEPPPSHDVYDLLDGTDLEITFRESLVNLSMLGEPLHRPPESHVTVAGKLGVDRVVVPTFDPSEATAGETRERLREVAEQLHDVGAGHGVEVLVANVSQSRSSREDRPSLDDFGWLLDRTSVSMALDATRAARAGHDSEAIAEFVATHADAVSQVYLHVYDSGGDHELGRDEVDADRVLAALADAGWDGTICLQCLDVVPNAIGRLGCEVRDTL